MTPTSFLRRAAPFLGGAARVVLGILWLSEGILKVRAGFGAADVRLVVESTAHNARVPWYFAVVRDLMNMGADVLGVMVPLIELGLGITLVLGLVSRWAALGSSLMLALYWSSDQLIAEYPVMLLLTAAVLFVPESERFSVAWVVRRLRKRPAPQ